MRSAAGRHRTDAGAPELGPHERALVREECADGAVYVGTNHALYHHDSAPGDGWHRIAWAEIRSLEWSRTSHSATFRLWPGSSTQTQSLQFRERSRLPEFSAERISSCQLANRQVQVTSSCSATMSAERDPGSGVVTWATHLDECCDRDDPALAPAVEHVLDDLRAQFGC